MQKAKAEWEQIMKTLDANTAKVLQNEDASDSDVPDDTTDHLMQEAGHAVERLITTTYPGQKFKKLRDRLYAQHTTMFE